MTARQQQIIETYKQEGSYENAARVLTISRQRVEQVIKIYVDGDPELLKIKNRFDHSNEFCLVCERSFREVSYSARGICASCFQYEKIGKGRRRVFQMPKACVTCKREFKGIKEQKEDYKARRCPGDLCSVCYSKTDIYKKHQRKYQTKPEIKAKSLQKLKEYKLKYPERIRASRRKYRLNNLERFREYDKKKYLKNRDYYRERFKRDYVKRRLNKEDLIT